MLSKSTIWCFIFALMSRVAFVHDSYAAAHAAVGQGFSVTDLHKDDFYTDALHFLLIDSRTYDELNPDAKKELGGFAEFAYFTDDMFSQLQTIAGMSKEKLGRVLEYNFRRLLSQKTTLPSGICFLLEDGSPASKENLAFSTVVVHIGILSQKQERIIIYLRRNEREEGKRVPPFSVVGYRITHSEYDEDTSVKYPNYETRPYNSRRPLEGDPAGLWGHIAERDDSAAPRLARVHRLLPSGGDIRAQGENFRVLVEQTLALSGSYSELVIPYWYFDQKQREGTPAPYIWQHSYAIPLYRFIDDEPVGRPHAFLIFTRIEGANRFSTVLTPEMLERTLLAQTNALDKFVWLMSYSVTVCREKVVSDRSLIRGHRQGAAAQVIGDIFARVATRALKPTFNGWKQATIGHKEKENAVTAIQAFVRGRRDRIRVAHMRDDLQAQKEKVIELISTCAGQLGVAVSPLEGFSLTQLKSEYAGLLKQKAARAASGKGSGGDDFEAALAEHGAAMAVQAGREAETMRLLGTPLIAAIEEELRQAEKELARRDAVRAAIPSLPPDKKALVEEKLPQLLAESDMLRTKIKRLRQLIDQFSGKGIYDSATGEG